MCYENNIQFPSLSIDLEANDNSPIVSEQKKCSNYGETLPRIDRVKELFKKIQVISP